MSEEAKQFMFGLEQCRELGGMQWYGRIPSEIQELFNFKQQELVRGYSIAGVYVTIHPSYKAYTPEERERSDVTQ